MTEKLNELDQLLASEYALGVLDNADMIAAGKRYDNDLLFRQEVDLWHNRLTPMLDDVETMSPGAQVWEKIEAIKFGQSVGADEKAESGGLWHSLIFWRGFSIISAMTAAIALGVLLLPGKNTLPDDGQSLVASLTPTGKAPAFMARFDRNAGALNIRYSQNEYTETKAAELWLIPKDGQPHSLGLLDKRGQADIIINAGERLIFAEGGILAVSLEPPGGSPTGQPTGPVIASGIMKLL